MQYFIFHKFFSFFGPHKKVWGCLSPQGCKIIDFYLAITFQSILQPRVEKFIFYEFFTFSDIFLHFQ